MTASIGPVFIVLDEIGAAFDQQGLDDFSRRELFLTFCDQILATWFSLDRIFFLICGRASFLSYVGVRPTGARIKPIEFDFKRLTLHLLRPHAILEILKNTPARSGRDMIQGALGIDDKDIQELAQVIFRKTCGHPRSVANLLVACDTCDKIKNYITPIDIDLFYPD